MTRFGCLAWRNAPHRPAHAFHGLGRLPDPPPGSWSGPQAWAWPPWPSPTTTPWPAWTRPAPPRPGGRGAGGRVRAVRGLAGGLHASARPVPAGQARPAPGRPGPPHGPPPRPQPPHRGQAERPGPSDHLRGGPGHRRRGLGGPAPPGLGHAGPGVRGRRGPGLPRVPGHPGPGLRAQGPVHPGAGLAALKAEGASTILAHPFSLRATGRVLEKKVRRLKDLGLDGLECLYPEHSPDQTREYLRLAEKLDLAVTGGSDFHGPAVKPDIELGVGNGSLTLPYAMLDSLRERRARQGLPA